MLNTSFFTFINLICFLNHLCVKLHITLTPFYNENRGIKETSSLLNSIFIDKILIAALFDQ